ncbi:MAG: VOC family protein [Actinomycetota bacterium]
MTVLHPRGVNHLALSTTDMKAQLQFWCDVLGCPLKALYWMHGVEGCYHGFVELSPDSYVAFVQHPENGKEIEWGVSHAGSPGGPVTAGAMQHVAFHVDSLDDLLALRDRIRSRGVQVMGPIDHGFIQSMYFAGPEGLSLEIATGSAIDERAWIDPEVTGLCGITASELAELVSPSTYDRPEAPVTQPPFDEAPFHMFPPERWKETMSVPDDVMWEHASETTPPVQVDD